MTNKVSLIDGVGNTGHLQAKDEIRSHSYPIYKNTFKVDSRLKYKT